MFALLLRREGVAAPSAVMPGVAADVIFDWHWSGGKYTEIRIKRPYSAELFAHVPGTPVRHLVILGERREAAA